MSPHAKTVASAFALASLCAVLGASVALALGQSFSSLQSGFSQSLFGVSTADLGGVAVAPNGDTWATECSSAHSPLHRFDAQHASTVHGSTLQSESVAPSDAGCGLANHPDGTLYSNTGLGVRNLDASTAAVLRTLGVPGNALGIAVDPRTNHLVYVAGDCRFTSACSLIDLDPLTGTTTTFARLASNDAQFVDGIAFDPTGNFVFLANRAPLFRLTVLTRSGAVVQHIRLPSEPDGVAVHGDAPVFVVTSNTDGTLTRLDFPSGDFTQPPLISALASGAFRGDLLQVGADGCLHVTQAGTRFDDGSVANNQSSLVRVCGPSDFSRPPGVPSLTPTPSVTATATGTATPTATATQTVTPNPTDTSTVTPTLTPTQTVTPIPTETSTITPGPTGTPTVTVTPTPTQTFTPMPAPTQTPTPSPTQTFTPTATPTSISAGVLRSLSLGGNTASAEAAANPDLDLTGDWTIQLWLRDADPLGFDHDYRYLLNKGDGVDPEAPYLALLGRGNLLVGVRSGGVNHPLTYPLNFLGFSPKLWQHVTATFSASNTTLTLYMNGSQVAQQTLGVRSTGNALPLEVGRQGAVLAKYWFGKLDDIRIWNRVLSADEIQNGYKTEFSGPATGLIANWKFNADCSGLGLDSVGSHTLALFGPGIGFANDVPTAPNTPGGGVCA